MLPKCLLTHYIKERKCSFFFLIIIIIIIIIEFLTQNNKKKKKLLFCFVLTYFLIKIFIMKTILTQNTIKMFLV